jgi:hypothetical protein
MGCQSLKDHIETGCFLHCSFVIAATALIRAVGYDHGTSDCGAKDSLGKPHDGREVARAVRGVWDAELATQ